MNALRAYGERQRLNDQAINAIMSGCHVRHLEIDNDQSRFKLLRAGRKFRKTTYMIKRLMRSAINTGLTCPYIAPNRIQAKNIAWLDHVARELTKLKSINFPYKTNESELSVTFPNSPGGNGRIILMGVENKEALRGISNWGDLGGDELDDWSEDIWPTIIRPNLMTNKAPAILSGTPKGMRYMYSLEYADEKIFKSFHYSSYDNPELDPEELEAMVKEYKSFGDDYFQQEIMAEYMKPVGLVYKEWDLSHYKEFDYDPNLPLHVTFDWGVNDPTVIIWIQPCGGEYRVIDYAEFSDGSIDYIMQVLNSKPYKKPELYTGDPAGKQRSLTTGISPIEMLSQRGIHVRSKDGVQIEDQIRQTHTIIPSLFVSHKAERFKNCLLNYRYPSREEKRSKLDYSNEKPIHDEFSHAMRALEYYAVNAKDCMPKPKRKIIGWSGGDPVTGYGRKPIYGNNIRSFE